MNFVEVEGARVAYRVDGPKPAGGTGVVLVHGTGGDGETHMASLARRLAARWCVVRPDYAGSGATRDGGGALTVPGLAAQVVAAATAAGLERFHLLGYSLGAVVAVQVAADHPRRVRALVPLGGFVSGADSRLQMMLRLWLDLMDRDRESLARHWILTGFGPAYLSKLTRETLEDYVALTLLTKSWDGIRRQIELDLAVDVEATARRVAVPALVIGCSQDQMVPPVHAQALAACIRDARYAELDSGHAAPLECPDVLLDIVEPFFAAVEAEPMAASARAG